MGAVVTVVAHDRRRGHDHRSQQRTLRVPERAHARARTVIRVTAIRLAHHREARVSVASSVHRAIRRRQLGMREAYSITG